MSDKPVAKRTRLSVSRSQNESMKVKSETEKMHQELRTLFETMMSKCDEIIQLVPEVNQTVNTMKIGTECQRQELQNNITKTIEDEVVGAQKGLYSIKQIIDYVSIEKLHLDQCVESEQCILRMQRELKRDPLSLERKQEIDSTRTNHGSSNVKMNHRQSPLHHAVIKGHVKCVKFLLQRGADVTSITTIENHSILHSLYYSSIEREKRLQILKLLLKYGVSRIFHYKYAGGHALIMTFTFNSLNDITLLVQHGATMSQEDTESVIIEAWKMCNLQMLKILLLQCSSGNYLNLGVFLYDFCRQLIHLTYMKMILAGVPLDKCHEKFLEALQFYKVFGGRFCVFPWKVPRQNLMNYLKRYKRRKHFSGAMLRIKAIVSNPMSLKEISRLAVCKLIRKDYYESIKKLPVVDELQSFLRFEDVIITERPEKFDENAEVDTFSSGSECDDGDDDDSCVKVF